MDEMKLSKIDKDIIGLGGQAVVYHGLYGDIPVAVKVLTEIDWKSLSNELIIIANIVHDNIPKFYGMIIENSKIEMVFEYVEGKTLDNFSEKCFAYFSDKEKLNIIKGIAGAIKTLYDNNCIHRDLKPENILIDNNKKPYLIDFGISKILMEGTNSIKTRGNGSINYVAPEVYDGDEDDDEYEDEDEGKNDNNGVEDEKHGTFVSLITHKVDIWALGCIISYLYSGYTPWTPYLRDNEYDIMDNLIKKTAFPIPTFRIKDENIKKVISVCCEVDLKKRANIIEVIELLNKINL